MAHPRRRAPGRALSVLLVLLATLPGTTRPAAAQQPQPAYDVVIENGRIVDGTGNAWYYGDVAIRGDRIARIAPPGALANARAQRRIDATDRVVAPGFVDIQSHSRDPLLYGDGRVISKVTQGITTEIMGESVTNAPLNPRRADLADVEEPEVRENRKAFAGPHAFDAWLRAMEDHGASVNLGSFLGASTVRVYAKGHAMGEPTPAEVDTMRAVVRRAMRDGAFGFATALIYPPGNFATTEELIEMAKAMAPFGGVYITHMRSEADQLLDAIDEAIRIGREGGVPVEIYHLKAAGRRNWHKAEEAIAKIDLARAQGMDVQANMYPYVAGGTGLTACLPPWVSADDRLFENLQDAEARRRIRDEIEGQEGDWENLCQLAGPEGVLLLGLEKEENQEYVGQRLSEVSESMGKDWIEAAMDLILSERQRIGTIYFLMSEENVKLQLRQPWIKFGTDAAGVNPAEADSVGLVHPRSYGTFPRIMGHYVRDENVLPLEEAVRKATSAVTTRLGIQDRGVLKPGFYADVVVFNPKTILDRATFPRPHQLSVGVDHVLVNGVPVVADGEHTGAEPGRIVRGPGWSGGGR